ncbi:MAG: SDR family oxidoreductase [Trueperaceae bacterium]
MTQDNPFAKALENKRIIIVGGGSRMGFETARLSLSFGAEVVISSRSSDQLEQAAKELDNGVKTFAADFSNASQAEKLLTAFAPFDHLVVTASANGSGSSIVQTSPDMAKATFSRFWMSYHALHFALNKVKPHGSITLLSGSSSSRRTPVAGYGIWATVHGSIEMLAKAAALELAPIRVNVVSPGGIGIRSNRQLAHHAGAFIDVAMAIVGLMANPAITATVVDVDGGERLGDWP